LLLNFIERFGVNRFPDKARDARAGAEGFL